MMVFALTKRRTCDHNELMLSYNYLVKIYFIFVISKP